MKTLLALNLAICFSLTVEADDASLYELRVYYANPEKLDDLHARFRDHTLALFEKHGMTNIGYWVPTENSENKLVYLLSYPDLEGRKASWKAFLADETWKAAYSASTADGKLVAKIEKYFLKTTDYSPVIKVAQEEPTRLFELREYETNPGKLGNLDARFRDHTIGLFEKYGISNLIYMHLLDNEEQSDQMLIYFVAHKDEAARTASFKAFGQDPAWQEARKASEENGKILVKGGVSSTLLEPTDYSPTQ